MEIKALVQQNACVLILLYGNYSRKIITVDCRVLRFTHVKLLTNFLYPSLIYIHFDCIRPIKAKCGKTEKLG